MHPILTRIPRYGLRSLTAGALALAETLPAPTFRSRGPWCELDAWESDEIRRGGGKF